MSSMQVQEMLDVRRERKELGMRERLTSPPRRGEDSPLKRALIHLVLIITTIIIVFPVDPRLQHCHPPR